MKILFITTIILFIGCSKKEEPGYEYMPDMVYSQAYEAYSESAITPNGASMLPAPKGSISREHLPFEYGNTDEEKERADQELINLRINVEEVIHNVK